MVEQFINIDLRVIIDHTCKALLREQLKELASGFVVVRRISYRFPRAVNRTPMHPLFFLW